MSEAILTFHAQLSVVMETVLKAAVFEITRLVESSFQAETAQSKQEVEVLRQRLQEAEKRSMVREGHQAALCRECGRACREEADRPGQEMQSGVAGRCDVKEEKVPEGNHSSCVWEVPPQDLAIPRFTHTPEVGCATIITIDLEEDTIDQLHDPKDLRESAGHLQWRHCTRQQGPGAVDVAQLEEGEAWGPGAFARGRWGVGGPPYGLKACPQRVAPLAPRPMGPNRTAFGKVDSQQTPAFTSHSSGSPGGSPKNGRNALSPFDFVNVKAEVGLSESDSMKEEAEALSVWTEEAGSADAHVQQRPHSEEREELLSDCLPLVASPEGIMRLVKTNALVGWEQPRGLPVREGLVPANDGRAASSDAPEEDECNLCDAGFAPSDEAEARLVDGGEGKSFSCLHCGKTFSQLRNLKDHQRYHTGNKTHSCAHCGKGFVYMCHLKVHLQSHTGERPYSCAQCGKTFTYLCNLKSHQQYHTGERPFSCTQCGKSFRHLSHLKKHGFMHTGERPYRCTDCGKRFAGSGDLKRHQRIHAR